MIADIRNGSDFGKVVIHVFCNIYHELIFFIVGERLIVCYNYCKDMLKPEERPEKVYGCEVWRDLDWVCDDEKVYLDCGPHPNLMRCLSAVFDSQIAGGKRYDLAAEGRRLANATFSASHACDTYSALNYAMDLTPLMDKTVDIADYIAGFVDRFKMQVMEMIGRLYQ